MDLDVVVLEQDKESIRSDYGEKVLQSFKDKLDRKKQKFSWFNNIDQVSQRFYQHFSFNSIRFFEMRFSSQSGDYRALFYVPQSEERLVFVDVFKKDDYTAKSRQRQLIEVATSDIKGFREKMQDKQRAFYS